MASSNKYARKVFNSPTYAEPCLVASAKQVLLKENWCVHLPSIDPPARSSCSLLGANAAPMDQHRVFLHGKEHADYRRGLNGLFTRRALG